MSHTGADSPLVTIVTPSFNQGPFIEQALASVRAQTYTNVEHLVIDGGSTDGTLAILRASEGSGVRWITESDEGMYDALNKGIAMARGEIVGYLNGDDVYTPWAIETAVRVLATDLTAVGVFGDGLTIDQARDLEPQRLTLMPPVDPRWLAFAGSLVQPAVFWRRAVTEATPAFDAGLRYVGDLDLWLRLTSQGRFARVDEVLAVERWHGAALSSASADRMAVEDALMRRRHHGASGSSARIGRLIARARAAWWRRRLLLSFLLASRAQPGGDRQWDRFLAEGVGISATRIVLSLTPRLGARFAWNAVRSHRSWLQAVTSTRPSPEDQI